MKKKDKYYCPECKKTFNELIQSRPTGWIISKPDGTTEVGADYTIYEYCPHCWSKEWKYNV